jgi:CheY-like chemotaxis protein
VSGPVLVVEDDRDMRAFLFAALTSAGFQVVTAENGLAALEQLRRHRPCVILLDLELPLLDGAGFLRAVHADPEFPVVPVICVSGQHNAREQAKALGLAECLQKPIAVDALLASVLRACQD